MAFKLETNEHILLIVRRHWFKPVLETLALLFSLLIPLIISSVIYSLPNLKVELGNTTVLSIVFILAWLFVVWNFVFIIWTNRYLDAVIVTNMHIIDIEQVTLWHREISTLSLEKIQDISSETEGIIENLLDYGNIEIQTAGSIANFIVKGIEKPDLVRQKINEQIQLLNERI